MGVKPDHFNLQSLRCSVLSGTVTGILVLKILVPRTKIFSGKLVPPDQNFQENWSASGNLVLVQVRIIQDSLLVYQLYDIIHCLLEIIVA